MHKTLLLLTLLLTAHLAAVPPAATTLAESHHQVTAHRGSSASAPENTLAAIRQAIADGSGYAEIDVQETADGVVMLMHDDSVLRTTGIDKPMWKVTADELRQASAGAWFHKRFEAERVPSLEEAVRTAKGRIRLNVELKNNGHGRRLAEETVRLLQAQDAVRDCTVTSFDGRLLAAVKKLDPRIKTGLIIGEKRSDMAAVLANPTYDAISIAYTLVQDTLVNEAAKHGKEVYVWTVNDPAVMERMLNLGVTSIITNHPEQLVRLIRAR
ncbi:glycerophosphodiester phosphodiesterase [Paenibacillus mucilaginosus]|uniref:Glycerophosphoryl diester phosphodiesterase family protein n=1 Tax=Paenibacillus mucilaginosus (strain KNP414) TaxID=1036673 RepID=F8FEG5_PAEMK|nr:glycerophosphodiester phosphodiesterase family protein [Paenibacillus mucilaginosus]AEI44564.1 glycerophosphoryl diester phosphodiesterase family protein [Paenibacillus mucilaginosus KNP414]MCG7215508.1 glycerophosphodiester phosphodiesterase [Paenibacillus mucilaginosus]WDM26140.1 glycerophosphodiester phosphodiesterase [Paenibacillus mucilaginosus]WFA20854.1 glycerophosphodiester phosphodiesterase [Paenibacillus mucilaginosus]